MFVLLFGLVHAFHLTEGDYTRAWNGPPQTIERVLMVTLAALYTQITILVILSFVILFGGVASVYKNITLGLLELLVVLCKMNFRTKIAFLFVGNADFEVLI